MSNTEFNSNVDAIYQVITVLNDKVILQNPALVLDFDRNAITMVGTNSAAVLIVNARSRIFTISCICQAIKVAAIPIAKAKPMLILNIVFEETLGLMKRWYISLLPFADAVRIQISVDDMRAASIPTNISPLSPLGKVLKTK